MVPASNQLSKQTIRNDRRQYEKTKALLKKKEESNYSCIYLIQSPNSPIWFKMGGNSLLIYRYEVCQKNLNFLPNVMQDNDFEHKFPDGVISVRGIDSLEKNLRRAGVFKAKETINNVVKFSLNISVTPLEIEAMRIDHKDAQEKALETVRPKCSLDPVSFEIMRRLQKRTYEIARRFSPWDREYAGKEMAALAKHMIDSYYDMNLGLLSEKTGWEQIRNNAQRLSYNLAEIVDLQLTNYRSFVNLWEDARSLARHIDKAIIKKMTEKASDHE